MRPLRHLDIKLYRVDERHPRLYRFVLVLARLRTPAAFVVVTAAIAAQIAGNVRPLALEPSWLLLLGLGLVAVGTGIRLAALGCRRDEPVLYTSGVYSLCRHPLYLGTITLTAGFCTLLNDGWNFAISAGYFVVFYTAAMIKEEVRMRRRFGDEHRQYCLRTPLLLPTARPTSRGFRWAAAMRSGAVPLVVWVLILLAGVGSMAILIPPS